MWRLVLNSLKEHSKPSEGTLKIDEAPHYQRSNPYIHTGYRAPQTWSQCARSILQFHNETLNIWTHLLGAFAFVALLLWYWEEASSGRDFVIILTVVVLYQACMVLSAIFHTFNSHSREASEFCLMLDLGGISCSITASYISGIYYAFWCHPGLQYFYMLTVLGFILTGLVFRNTFNKDENLIPRLVFFTTFVIYGFVPTIHWCFMNGFGSDETRLFLPRVLMMYLLAGLAFLFYIAKFPEVVLPGRFDILGSSHQWWHLFIFLCLAYWYTTGVALSQYRAAGSCNQGYEIDPALKAATEARFWVTF